jgi:hypothetical protein
MTRVLLVQEDLLPCEQRTPARQHRRHNESGGGAPELDDDGHHETWPIALLLDEIGRNYGFITHLLATLASPMALFAAVTVLLLFDFIASTGR